MPRTTIIAIGVVIALLTVAVTFEGPSKWLVAGVLLLALGLVLKLSGRRDT